MMMKTKITLITTVLVCAVSASFVHAAEEDVSPITVNGGVVQFTGNIVNAPCSVAGDSAGQFVDLGQWRTGDFKTVGDVTGPKSFKITLEDCALETFKKASISFSGNASSDSKSLVVEGGAKGVGIQISKNGTPMEFNGGTTSPSDLLEGADNHIYFDARYVSIATDVTPGKADATTSFTVTYM